MSIFEFVDKHGIGILIIFRPGRPKDREWTCKLETAYTEEINSGRAGNPILAYGGSISLAIKNCAGYIRGRKIIFWKYQESEKRGASIAIHVPEDLSADMPI